MNINHCINNLVDTSINKDAESCDMEINTSSSSSSSKCDFNTKNKCCSTDIIIKEADNELKKTTISNYSDSVIFLYSYINLFEGLEENVIPFLNYDSPLISKDLQVINQTFLI